MKTNADRFSEKVEKTDSCWIWTASLTGKGYGAFRPDGRRIDAHRFSWELHHGKITAALWVLHRCDNRRCVNPAHLFLGTAKDNTQDMMSKGRNKWVEHRGENHANHKLQDIEVLMIRNLYKEGAHSQRALAREFGCSQGQVHFIVTDKQRVMTG